MTSASLISTNDKMDSDSDIKNIKDNRNYNPATHFKAFDSVLYMSEFLGNEDNQASEKSSNKENENISNLSPNSYKEFAYEDILNLEKLSPSLEKCLTSELLDSITNDSSNKKKSQILKFNNYNNNEKLSNEKISNLKITKKLFNQDMIGDKKSNEMNRKPLYIETINGFKYQLKFIENSINNILPKSYKKISNKILEKNNSGISSFIFSNEYKNSNYTYDKSLCKYENNDYSNKGAEYYNYNPSLDSKYNNKGIEKQTKHQIHKLKKADNFYCDWICNKCNSFNRGYRKTCVNCGYY